MLSLPTLIEAWDEAYRELEISIDGTPDHDVWARPHPKLLSIGELVAHIGYGHASWILCAGKERPAAGDFPFLSPILGHEFRYYLSSVEAPVTLDLTVSELWGEIGKIRVATQEVLIGLDYDSPYPGQWGKWGNIVQYMVFHVAYHTGQIYSVRHLLGHETEDN